MVDMNHHSTLVAINHQNGSAYQYNGLYVPILVVYVAPVLSTQYEFPSSVHQYLPFALTDCSVCVHFFTAYFLVVSVREVCKPVGPPWVISTRRRQ